MLARTSFLAFVALVSVASTACDEAPSSGAATAAPPTTAAATPGQTAAAAGTVRPSAVPAGTGKPSAAECEAMTQHFLDLAWDEALAEDAELRNSSAVEKEIIKKTIQSEAKNDPDFKSVAAECKKELSRKEYSCVMAAKTMKAFDKCVE